MNEMQRSTVRSHGGSEEEAPIRLTPYEFELTCIPAEEPSQGGPQPSNAQSADAVREQERREEMRLVVQPRD